MTDLNLYAMITGKDFIVLVIDADNIVLLGQVQPAVGRFIPYFKKHLEIWISEIIDKVLGMNVEDNGSGVRLHNKRIIERPLKEFWMVECKPVATPLPADLSFN